MEENLKELATIISQHHIGCNLPIDCNTQCDECLAKAILEAGYLPVEPVQLEVLGDEEIKQSAYYCPYCDSEDCSGCGIAAYEAGSQATITHNEAKGQLYRRIDNADGTRNNK